jgi:hypothetical protein
LPTNNPKKYPYFHEKSRGILIKGTNAPTIQKPSFQAYWIENVHTPYLQPDLHVLLTRLGRLSSCKTFAGKAFGFCQPDLPIKLLQPDLFILLTRFKFLQPDLHVFTRFASPIYSFLQPDF